MYKLMMIPIVLIGAGFVACEAPDYSKELTPVADAYIEVWNTGNLDGLDNIAAPEHKRHSNPSANTSAANRDSLKSAIANTRKIYPDFKVSVNERIFSKDRVVTRWTVTGTHSGFGLESLKGNTIKADGITVIHYSNGKMIEEWASWDHLDVMMQQGFTLQPPADKKE